MIFPSDDTSLKDGSLPIEYVFFITQLSNNNFKDNRYLFNFFISDNIVLFTFIDITITLYFLIIIVITNNYDIAFYIGCRN